MQLNKYTKQLGQRLLSLRQEKGLSQVEAATEIGITQAALSSYETGKRCPMIDNAYRLANYYGVSIGWLAGLKGDER